MFLEMGTQLLKALGLLVLLALIISSTEVVLKPFVL